MQKTNLVEMTWDEVRSEVHKVNPNLAQQIDNISPSNKFKLLKASYPFGVDIVNFGELQIPNTEGKIVNRRDSLIHKSIEKQLAYAPTMPMGIVLNHTLEMQWQRENNIVAWYVMRPGNIFGSWGLMQEPGTTAQTARVWKISAGSRSLIILPKISDALGYKRFKKEFGLTTDMPSGLSDQWNLLKELTESSQFNAPWHADLLFFTEAWYKKIRDGSWKELEYFLLKSAWNETSYLRDEGVFNFIFSMALAEKNLKPNPYLTDTVRHLYGIARNSVPSYKVAVDDISAPIQRLEQIFAEVYQHKFAPTFMHLGYFDPINPMNPVYYSLEIPTVSDFSPKSRKAANKMNDIREVKHIQTMIEKFIQENTDSLVNTPVYDAVYKANYGYYHSDQDILNELNSSHQIVELDNGMQRSTQIYGKPICTTSPFLRGCIRIACKTNGNK